MRQTPVNDYLEEISTRLPEEIYGRLSDAIYETTCDFDEEVGLLKAENAKLRELVRSVLVLRHDLVYKWLDATTAEVCGKSFTEQARELGIEVDA